jgi:hypothetical protein
MELIRPSVWRSTKRNTVLRVRAVRIARGEYQGCPPRVVRGSAARRDCFIREPDRQTSTLAQAGVIGRSVRALVLLPCDVVTAGLVQLEGQGEHPKSEEGRLLRHPAPEHQPTDQPIHATRPPRWPNAFTGGECAPSGVSVFAERFTPKAVARVRCSEHLAGAKQPRDGCTVACRSGSVAKWIPVG